MLMAKANETNDDNKTNASVPTVNWDDSDMASSYANVVNAFSTREELTLLFGTNQTWSLGGDNSVDIKLSNRMVMNPIVAKRLHILMGRLLDEYENRYGAMEVGGASDAVPLTN
jgi:hypothetical protein